MAQSKRVKSADRRRGVTRGSTNVSTDLGFRDSVERQAKLRLAYALNQLLTRRQLSPADTVKVLGVTRAEGAGLRLAEVRKVGSKVDLKVDRGDHAAPLHSCKYRWLHAPATKFQASANAWVTNW
jgi:hypothetical protein